MSDTKRRVRMDRIRVLIETRHDYLIPAVRATESPTAAPGKYVTCEKCRGTGRDKGQFCHLCDGVGERRRRKGDKAVDGYTGAELSTATTAAVRTMTLAELDSSIAHLDRMQAQREHDPTFVPDDAQEEWERERDRRDEAGSYVELDRILRGMHLSAVSFLDQYHTGVITPTPGAQLREQELVAAIEAMMPEKIRVPSWAYRDETQRIAHIVRDLASRGKKISEIATDIGVSRRRVQSILKESRT